MEGKIKIYSYGYTIDNLIQQEINPESELMTIQKVNPFSLTAGKDFVLVIKRKTKAWRDFSSSKFMSEVSPLIITTQGKEIPTSNDPKVMQFVSKYFKENSPDLTQYFYKDWTDYEYEKVAEYIKAIVPYKQIIDNLVGGLKDERMKKHFTNTKSISRTVAPAGESLEFTPAAPQTKGTSISIDIDSDMLGSTASKPTAAPAKPEVDELDSIFNDL
jgi:hypothetical protein